MQQAAAHMCHDFTLYDGSLLLRSPPRSAASTSRSVVTRRPRVPTKLAAAGEARACLATGAAGGGGSTGSSSLPVALERGGSCSAARWCTSCAACWAQLGLHWLGPVGAQLLLAAAVA